MSLNPYCEVIVLMKKEVSIIVLILLATIVYAVPNATITLTPLSVYETSNTLFNLTINNQFKDEVISQITLSSSQLNITNVVNFSDWNNSFTATSIDWDNGDIETNAIALFQFYAQAGLISDNQSINLTIITTGPGGDTTDIIQLNITNDYSGPILSSNTPQDNGFLRQGITNQTISIDAVDPETGVLNTSFAYWNCTNVSNQISVTLTCVNNTCTSIANLSAYQEGDRMCFAFTSYNNALEFSTLNGSVGFDNTPPTVTLVSPTNGSVASGNTSFLFNATDNLAPTLTCSLLVNDVTQATITAINSTITTLYYDVSNLSEAVHDWKISCEDGVGLIGESETRNILTGSGPEINLTINIVERTVDYLINATITDETAVANAYAVFNNQTITLTAQGDNYIGTLSTDINYTLGNYSLTIFANDTLFFSSNRTLNFTLIQGYIITLNLDPATAEPGSYHHEVLDRRPERCRPPDSP